jgi:hypothetical protein
MAVHPEPENDAVSPAQRSAGPAMPAVGVGWTVVVALSTAEQVTPEG